MTEILLNVPSEWDWLLVTQLQKAIRRDWQVSLLMAPCSEDVYFADVIDQTADLLLQLMSHINIAFYD